MLLVKSLPLSAQTGRSYRIEKAGAASIAALTTAEKPIQFDDAKMMVTSVITSPRMDRQGDVVEPDGIDLSVHSVNPVVFYDHRKSPEWQLPIGKSETPGGTYTVRRWEDKTLADLYFAQNYKPAEEVYTLVRQDILRGISIGYLPGIERNSVEKIPGGNLRYNTSVLHEISVTPQPTNPEALTIALEKGSFSQLIMKSLSPFMISKANGNRPAMVTSGFRNSDVRKAMAKPEVEEENAELTDADNLGEGDAGEGGEMGEMGAEGGEDMPVEEDYSETEPSDGLTPAPRAYLNIAQGIMDLIGQFNDDMAGSEHAESRLEHAPDFANRLQEIAEEAKAYGEKVAAELNGGVPPEETPDPNNPDMMETDPENGEVVVKSFILGFKPRRAFSIFKTLEGTLLVKKGGLPLKRLTKADILAPTPPVLKSESEDEQMTPEEAREARQLLRRLKLARLQQPAQR